MALEGFKQYAQQQLAADSSPIYQPNQLNNSSNNSNNNSGNNLSNSLISGLDQANQQSDQLRQGQSQVQQDLGLPQNEAVTLAQRLTPFQIRSQYPPDIANQLLKIKTDINLGGINQNRYNKSTYSPMDTINDLGQFAGSTGAGLLGAAGAIPSAVGLGINKAAQGLGLIDDLTAHDNSNILKDIATSSLQAGNNLGEGITNYLQSKASPADQLGLQRAALMDQARQDQSDIQYQRDLDNNVSPTQAFWNKQGRDFSNSFKSVFDTSAAFNQAATNLGGNIALTALTGNVLGTAAKSEAIMGQAVKASNIASKAEAVAAASEVSNPALAAIARERASNLTNTAKNLYDSARRTQYAGLALGQALQAPTQAYQASLDIINSKPDSEIRQIPSVQQMLKDGYTLQEAKDRLATNMAPYAILGQAVTQAPLGPVARFIPGAKGSSRFLEKGLLRPSLKDALSEAGQAAAGQVTTNLAAQSAGINQPTFENVGQAAGGDFAIGGIAGGLGKTLHTTANIPSNIANNIRERLIRQDTSPDISNNTNNNNSNNNNEQPIQPNINMNNTNINNEIGDNQTVQDNINQTNSINNNNSNIPTSNINKLTELHNDKLNQANKIVNDINDISTPEQAKEVVNNHLEDIKKNPDNYTPETKQAYQEADNIITNNKNNNNIVNKVKDTLKPVISKLNNFINNSTNNIKDKLPNFLDNNFKVTQNNINDVINKGNDYINNLKNSHPAIEQSWQNVKDTLTNNIHNSRNLLSGIPEALTNFKNTLQLRDNFNTSKEALLNKYNEIKNSNISSNIKNSFLSGARSAISTLNKGKDLSNRGWDALNVLYNRIKDTSENNQSNSNIDNITNKPQEANIKPSPSESSEVNTNKVETTQKPKEPSRTTESMPKETTSLNKVSEEKSKEVSKELPSKEITQESKHPEQENSKNNKNTIEEHNKEGNTKDNKANIENSRKHDIKNPKEVNKEVKIRPKEIKDLFTRIKHILNNKEKPVYRKNTFNKYRSIASNENKELLKNTNQTLNDYRNSVSLHPTNINYQTDLNEMSNEVKREVLPGNDKENQTVVQHILSSDTSNPTTLSERVTDNLNKLAKHITDNIDNKNLDEDQKNGLKQLQMFLTEDGTEFNPKFRDNINIAIASSLIDPLFIVNPDSRLQMNKLGVDRDTLEKLQELSEIGYYNVIPEEMFKDTLQRNLSDMLQLNFNPKDSYKDIGSILPNLTNTLTSLLLTDSNKIIEPLHILNSYDLENNKKLYFLSPSSENEKSGSKLSPSLKNSLDQIKDTFGFNTSNLKSLFDNEFSNYSIGETPKRQNIAYIKRQGTKLTNYQINALNKAQEIPFYLRSDIPEFDLIKQYSEAETNTEKNKLFDKLKDVFGIATPNENVPFSPIYQRDKGREITFKTDLETMSRMIKQLDNKLDQPVYFKTEFTSEGRIHNKGMSPQNSKLMRALFHNGNYDIDLDNPDNVNSMKLILAQNLGIATDKLSPDQSIAEFVKLIRSRPIKKIITKLRKNPNTIIPLERNEYSKIQAIRDAIKLSEAIEDGKKTFTSNLRYSIDGNAKGPSDATMFYGIGKPLDTNTINNVFRARLNPIASSGINLADLPNEVKDTYIGYTNTIHKQLDNIKNLTPHQLTEVIQVADTLRRLQDEADPDIDDYRPEVTKLRESVNNISNDNPIKKLLQRDLKKGSSLFRKDEEGNIQSRNILNIFHSLQTINLDDNLWKALGITDEKGNIERDIVKKPITQRTYSAGLNTLVGTIKERFNEVINELNNTTNPKVPEGYEEYFEIKPTIIQKGKKQYSVKQLQLKNKYQKQFDSISEFIARSIVEQSEESTPVLASLTEATKNFNSIAQYVLDKRIDDHINKNKENTTQEDIDNILQSTLYELGQTFNSNDNIIDLSRIVYEPKRFNGISVIDALGNKTNSLRVPKLSNMESSALAKLTIGFGDGAMITSITNAKPKEMGLSIYDGITSTPHTTSSLRDTANQSVLDSWKSKPLNSIVNRLSKINEFINKLNINPNEKLLVEGRDKISFKLLKERLNKNLQDLNKANDFVNSNIKLLTDDTVEINQMAESNIGDLYNTNNKESNSKLNKVIGESLEQLGLQRDNLNNKPTPDIPPEYESYETKDIDNLKNELDNPDKLLDNMDIILKSNPDLSIKLFNNQEDMYQYLGRITPINLNVKGFYDPVTQTIGLFRDSNNKVSTDTFNHEALHASTLSTLYNTISKDKNLSNSLQNITELLIDQINNPELKYAIRDIIDRADSIANQIQAFNFNNKVKSNLDIDSFKKALLVSELFTTLSTNSSLNGKANIKRLPEYYRLKKELSERLYNLLNKSLPKEIKDNLLEVNSKLQSNSKNPFNILSAFNSFLTSTTYLGGDLNTTDFSNLLKESGIQTFPLYDGSTTYGNTDTDTILNNTKNFFNKIKTKFKDSLKNNYEKSDYKKPFDPQFESILDKLNNDFIQSGHIRTLDDEASFKNIAYTSKFATTNSTSATELKKLFNKFITDADSSYFNRKENYDLFKQIINDHKLDSPHILMGLTGINDDFYNAVELANPKDKFKLDGLDNNLNRIWNNTLTGMEGLLDGVRGNGLDTLLKRVAAGYSSFKPSDKPLQFSQSLRTRLQNKLTNSMGKLADKINDTKIDNKPIKEIQSILKAALKDEFAQDFTEELSDRINSEYVPVWARNLMNEIMGRTTKNSDLIGLLKESKSKANAAALGLESSTKSFLGNLFKNKLTEPEWEALHGISDSGLDELNYSHFKNTIEGNIDTIKLGNILDRINPKLKKEADHLINYLSKDEISTTELKKNPEAIIASLNITKNVPQIHNLLSRYLSSKLYNNLPDSQKETIKRLYKENPNEIESLHNYMNNLHETERNKSNQLGNIALYNRLFGRGLKKLKDTRDSRQSIIKPWSQEQEDNLKYRGFNLIHKFKLPIGTNGTMIDVGLFQSGKFMGRGRIEGAYNFTQGTYKGVNIESGETMQNANIGATIRDFDIVSALRTQTDKNGKPLYNLLPIYDSKANIVGYELPIENSQTFKDVYHQRLDDNLSYRQSRNLMEDEGANYNGKVISTLHNTYNKELKENGNDYINKNYVNVAKDPTYKNEWNMISENDKDTIKQLFGKEEFFPIRKEQANTSLGYKAYTIADLANPNGEWKGPIKQFIAKFLQSLLGNNAYRILAYSEAQLQAATSMAKNIIVQRSGIVPLVNLVSNMVQLVMSGVPISRVISSHFNYLKEIKAHKALDNQIAKLNNKLMSLDNTNPKQETLIRNKIDILKNNQKKLRIHDLIDKGELESYADKLSEEEKTTYHGGPWVQAVEETINRIPNQYARTAAKYAIVSQDTPLYKMMESTNQYGDLIAKQIMYDYYTNDKKYDSDKAYRLITDDFINYTTPPGRMRHYLDSVGLTWFFNFKIRSIKLVNRMLRESPLSILPLSAIPFIHGIDIGTPFTDNLVTKFLDGKLPYSMGTRLFMRAPTMLLWNQLGNHL